jgi:hypothetical protein
MSRTALVLAIASVALALSTALLMKEVKHERDRLGVDGEPVHASAESSEVPSSEDDGATGKSASASRETRRAPAAENDGMPRARGSDRPPSAEVRARLHNQLLVRLYNDPQGRRELVEERIPLMRDKYLLLHRRLGVDDLQWQRFLEVVAEQQLGFAVARADCKATNTCDLLEMGPDRAVEIYGRVAEVIGEANAVEARRFDQSDLERRVLSDLQQEMSPDLRLSEIRSEELVAALVKVRDDTLRQMSAAQVPVGQFFDVKSGLLLYDKTLSTHEARLEAATNYSRRLREEARKYLSGKLLEAYYRQQDALLENMGKSEARAGP